jgi:hypothetical protein
LAVGWKRGLGIWSLSGRQTFLHHGADAEPVEDVDKKQSNALDKFVGVQHLVCLWKYALWLPWPDSFGF